MTEIIREELNKGSEMKFAGGSDLVRQTQGPPQAMMKQLLNFYNQGQFSNVVEQANALLVQYPETAIIWNILGAAKKGLGLIEEASEAFKKLTELNPTDSEGFNNLGVTLCDKNELQEAIEAYNRALILDPTYAEAHYNMGVTFQKQGKLKDSIKAYNKALSLKPELIYLRIALFS